MFAIYVVDFIHLFSFRIYHYIRVLSHLGPAWDSFPLTHGHATIICQTDNYSYYNIYNNHENHNDNGNINNNYDNVNDNLNYIINDNTCNNKYMISMKSNNNEDIKTIYFAAKIPKIQKKITFRYQVIT